MKIHSNYRPKRRVISLHGQKWQKIRQQVIARDSGLCQHCLLTHRYVKGTDVDHIDNNGDNNTLDNLMLLCHECHSIKTAKDMGKKVKHGFDENGYPLDPQHEWNAEKITKNLCTDNRPPTHFFMDAVHRFGSSE